VLTRERTLARPAGADQDDKRQVGDGDFHLLSKTPKGSVTVED
jgi:hypothetical protein